MEGKLIASSGWKSRPLKKLFPKTPLTNELLISCLQFREQCHDDTRQT